MPGHRTKIAQNYMCLEAEQLKFAFWGLEEKTRTSLSSSSYMRNQLCCTGKSHLTAWFCELTLQFNGPGKGKALPEPWCPSSGKKREEEHTNGTKSD